MSDQPLVTLRALGTYAMPMPVRRGKVFQRPAGEAQRYVSQGKAELVELPAPAKPEPQQDPDEAKAKASRARKTEPEAE